MRVIFLGTGGSLPSPRRNVTAVAVQVSSEIVLFDCGEGTQRQFMLSNASFMKVEHVFITHFHGDHFLGLPALVQSLNFSGRRRPLNIYGPGGTIETVRSMLSLGYFTSGFDIQAAEMEGGDVVELQGFSVAAVAMDHTVPCLGYVLAEDDRPGRFDPAKARRLGVPEGPRFRALQQGHPVEAGGRTITPDMVLGPKRRGRKIAISGDTRPVEAFADKAEGADLLIHEATLGSDLEAEAVMYGHTTAKGAAEIAVKARAKRLFMYHISPRYEDAGPLLEEARAVFPESYIASDLEEVQVTVGKEEGAGAEERDDADA